MAAAKRKVMVDYDEVLKHIGQFGRWQKRIHFLMWITSAIGGLAVVVFVFTAFKQKHRCAVPYCDVGKDSMFNDTETEMRLLELTEDIGVNTCKYMGLTDTPPPTVASEQSCSSYLRSIERNGSNLEVMACSSDDLIFDTSVVSTSLVSHYGWTCGNSYQRQIYGATYMLGMLLGSFFMGLLSDTFGRMKALCLGIVLVSLGGMVGAFELNAHGFGFFRFLTGIGGMANFMVTFVICVEYVGVKYTMLTGILIEIPFALGELVFGLEAYLIRDWVPLQIVAYAPLLIFLVLYFFVPESPRWLIAMGRVDEAEAIIRKGAAENGKKFPEELFKKQDHEPESNEKTIEQLEATEESETEMPTIRDLARPRVILFRTLNMMYQWFSVTMCYYGLSFAATSLLGDPYTNFLLSVCVEIPGYLFCIFVMDCWGRRPILSFAQLISGIACVLAGLLFEAPEGAEWAAGLQVFLSLIGKFGASACFAIVYVYTAELFPTVIRNTAIGSCSTIARVGGIIAILIGLTSEHWPPAPMLIMGIVAIVAGVLAINFPETVGTELPETMEEAINIGKNTKRGLCTCVCPESLGDWFKDD